MRSVVLALFSGRAEAASRLFSCQRRQAFRSWIAIQLCHALQRFGGGTDLCPGARRQTREPTRARTVRFLPDALFRALGRGKRMDEAVAFGSAARGQHAFSARVGTEYRLRHDRRLES